MDFKIISGGQTGVDQAGLEAVFNYMTSDPYPRNLIIGCGGTAPKGYRTESGFDTDLKEIYGLKESHSYNYNVRTEQNVIDSDATVIIIKELTGGSKKTIFLCQKHNKPYRVITWHPELETLPLATMLHDFVEEHNVKVLNVAGHRYSKWPKGKEFASKILDTFLEILDKLS